MAAASLLWVVAISGIAFFWRLGSTGLIDETEPRFAEAARQMLVTGDWVTPSFNGEPRFDKPPLLYWLMALAYGAFGTHAWAARLPSALSALAVVALSCYTLQRYGWARPDDARTSGRSQRRQRWFAAWIGAALVALTPETLAWARVGVADMLLTAGVAGSLLCFFMGYASQPARPQGALPNRWYWACYLLLACAVLAKGPVGLVLPGLAIAAFALYLGQLRALWREIRPLWGALIVLGLTLPWYASVTLRHGSDYISAFLGYHNIERFTSVVNQHSGPWYYYVPVVLLGFAPFSVYLPQAMARLRFWRRRAWQRQPRAAQLGLFALFWFASTFAFFSAAATKRPSYILPLIPAAAVLVALLWSEAMVRAPRARSWWASGLANVLLLLAAAAALAYSPRLLGPNPAAPNLDRALASSAVPERGAAILGLAALAVLLLLARPAARRWVWGANAIGMVAFVALALMPAYELVDRYRQEPLRELAAIARQAQQPQEPLLMLGFAKPSVVFYSQRSVTFVPEPSRAPMVASDAPAETALILARPPQLEAVGSDWAWQRCLGSRGAYQLIRVATPMGQPAAR